MIMYCTIHIVRMSQNFHLQQITHNKIINFAYIILQQKNFILITPTLLELKLMTSLF